MASKLQTPNTKDFPTNTGVIGVAGICIYPVVCRFTSTMSIICTANEEESNENSQQGV